MVMFYNFISFTNLDQEIGKNCESTSINTNQIERSCGDDKCRVETLFNEFSQSSVEAPGDPISFEQEKEKRAEWAALA